MIRSALAAVVVVALGAVASCAGRGPAPASVANRGTDAAAAPAPGDVTAEPGSSAGGVAIGTAAAEVRHRLGAAESDDGEFLQYYRRGVSVALLGERVDALHLYRGVPGGYEDEPWQPFPLRLPGGLTWTTPEAEVRRVLGPPSAEGALDNAPIPSHWLDYRARGVLFDFRDDDGRMYHVVIYAAGAQ